MDCRSKCTAENRCPHADTCAKRCKHCGICGDHHCHNTSTGVMDDAQQGETPNIKHYESNGTCSGGCNSSPVDPTPIVWEWIIDPAGNIISSSDSVYDLIGWEPRQVEGRLGFDLVPQLERNQSIHDFQQAKEGTPIRVTLECGDGFFKNAVYAVEAVRSKTTGAILAYKGRTVEVNNKPTLKNFFLNPACETS